MSWGFLGLGLSGKDPTCQCRRCWCGFNPWVGKIPWRRIWQPISWKIPRTEDPGGLESTASQKAGHLWETEHAHMHWYHDLSFIIPKSFAFNSLIFGNFNCRKNPISNLNFFNKQIHQKMFILFAFDNVSHQPSLAGEMSKVCGLSLSPWNQGHALARTGSCHSTWLHSVSRWAEQTSHLLQAP